jgi:hypothetical protein
MTWLREPPEPVLCCALAEDKDDHDTEACLAEQAEAAADRAYEQAQWRGWDE